MLSLSSSIVYSYSESCCCFSLRHCARQHKFEAAVPERQQVVKGRRICLLARLSSIACRINSIGEVHYECHQGEEALSCRVD